MTPIPILALDQIQFFATSVYPCSYIEGRIARSQVASPSDQIDSQRYSELVQQGFRRSGGFVYRPYCDHCQACTSIRIPVAEFHPNRSQRRAWSRHCHLVTRIDRPHFSEEHFELYQRYQQARHADGGMNNDGVDQYIEFLVSSRVNSFMIEFREPDTQGFANELRMVSIIDQLGDGLSAVYTFYDPQSDQSYGTYNVLWQLQFAKLLRLTHLYLGYWIAASHKMSYKANFRPHEILQHGHWTRDSEAVSSMTPFFTR